MPDGPSNPDSPQNPGWTPRGSLSQERRRLIQESAALVYDFGGSELAGSMPDDVVYVLVPDDNTILAASNLAAAQERIKKGDNVLIITASRGENQGKHYTAFSLPPSPESAGLTK